MVRASVTALILSLMSATVLADDATPAAPAQNVSDVQVRETPVLGQNASRRSPSSLRVRPVCSFTTRSISPLS